MTEDQMMKYIMELDSRVGGLEKTAFILTQCTKELIEGLGGGTAHIGQAAMNASEELSDLDEEA